MNAEVESRMRQKMYQVLPVALRDMRVFKELKSKLLDPGWLNDRSLETVWAEMVKKYDQERRMPEPDELAWVKDSVEDEFTEFEDTAKIQVDRLFARVSNYDRGVAAADGAEFAARWRNESGLRIATFCEAMFRKSFPETLRDVDPTGLSEFLNTAAATQSSLLEQDLAGDPNLIFPDDWAANEEVRKVFPCGVVWLDEALRSYRSKDTYLLIAPIGTLKTLTGVEVLVAGCEQSVMSYQQSPEEGIGITVYATYEMPMSDIRGRLLTRGAYIPQTRMEKFFATPGEERATFFSTGLQDAPQDELDKFERLRVALTNGSGTAGSSGRSTRPDISQYLVRGGQYRPEVERTSQISGLLNRYGAVLDFSGKEGRNRNAGTGGVVELQVAIETEVAKREAATGTRHYVRSVVVDYLGSMCDRFIDRQSGNNAKQDDHEYLQKQVDMITREVAAYFDTSVLVLHQASGTANSLASSAPLSKAGGKGSKTVAENVDAAIIVGTKDQRSSHVKFKVDKNRRNEDRRERVLFIDGLYGRAYDDSAYTVTNGQIIAIDSDVIGIDADPTGGAAPDVESFTGGEEPELVTTSQDSIDD